MVSAAAICASASKYRYAGALPTAATAASINASGISTAFPIAENRRSAAVTSSLVAPAPRATAVIESPTCAAMFGIARTTRGPSLPPPSLPPLSAARIAALDHPAITLTTHVAPPSDPIACAASRKCCGLTARTTPCAPRAAAASAVTRTPNRLASAWRPASRSITTVVAGSITSLQIARERIAMPRLPQPTKAILAGFVWSSVMA